MSTLQVRDEHGPVTALNELEMVRGVIFANVWQSHRIAMIAPDSGTVTGWLDLTGLLPASERARVDVLNGIAYDERGDRLLCDGQVVADGVSGRGCEVRIGFTGSQVHGFTGSEVR